MSATLIPKRAPAPLHNLQGWLVWRYEQKPGEKKPRKVPYYVTGGRRRGSQGNDADRARLVHFDAARKAAERRGFDGVGLAILPEFGIVALDFDGVTDETRRTVENLVAGTYAETSPSGKGVRAFMRGDLGNHKDAGEPFGFETFSSKGFVTVTGKVLDVCAALGDEDHVAPVTGEVEALAAKRFGRAAPEPRDEEKTIDEPLGLTGEQIESALAVLDPDMPHDEWLHVGMALHHETAGEGFAHWDAWSAKGSKYPDTETLRTRWDSFGSAARPITGRHLVRLAEAQGWIDLSVMDGFDVLEGTERPRFSSTPITELIEAPPLAWWIKGVLPKAELGMKYGDSGSGKTFCILDMMLAIARGVPWRGFKTEPGRVTYICAEGAGGLGKRLKAYQQAFQADLTAVPFRAIVRDTPNFLRDGDHVALAKQIKAEGGADIIVVDTLAQTTPGGNENSSEDMGLAIAHCRALGRLTSAMVILIHHSGKDASRGARGWSGQRAALDVELCVTRTDSARYVEVTKAKDGRDGEKYPFKLAVVPIGLDEDGDVIDSCVVEHTHEPIVTEKRVHGKIQRRVLDAVRDLVGIGGDMPTEDAVVERVVELEQEVTKGPERWDPKTRRNRAGGVRKAIEAMLRDEVLVKIDGRLGLWGAEK